MAKQKVSPIVKNWGGKNWPRMFGSPKSRRIIWIVTFDLFRPDEDDPLDDPYSGKQMQALFDWAEEIASTDQIYDWGLKLHVVSKEVDDKDIKTTLTFVRPNDLFNHFGSQRVTSILPDFHIRLIDTNAVDEWFLADFVPHYGWVGNNPWIDPNFIDVLYRWGVSGHRALKLADEVTRLLRGFYENSLSINDINLINQKAGRAKIISFPNLLIWKTVEELGGYVGPEIKLSSLKESLSLLPRDIS